MNRLYCLLLPLLMPSCIGKHKSDSPKVTVKPTVEHIVETASDTLIINLDKSKINWVATEMRGTKRRTGIISFKNGLFLIHNGKIVGGKFTVDMETMDVTDVPIHERIARENLLDHLKSNEFFNVTHYPISTLKLTNVWKFRSILTPVPGILTPL